MGSAHRFCDLIDHIPNPIIQRQVLDILGDVIQAADQVERVPPGGEQGSAKAGGDPQPVLFADLDCHTIFELLQGDPDGSFSTRSGVLPASDLNQMLGVDFFVLRDQIAIIEP